MALRPGRCLLMSSHFMPSPRSWMIRASSSPDHLDCFFAGDWRSVLEACRLTAPVGRRVVGTGPVPTVVAALDGMDVAERAAERGDAEDLERESSSSFGLSKSEISTVEDVRMVEEEYPKSQAGGRECTGLITCASLDDWFASV